LDYRKEKLKQIAETAVAASGKRLADLTEHEKLCIAIGAGCELDPTFCGFKLKNPVAFSEVKGQIVVHERV
jgi:hypothetical protein